MVYVEGLDRFEKINEEALTIKNELNVKNIEKLTDVGSVVSYKAKLNFAKAGPRLGGAVKEAAAVVGKLGDKELADFLKKSELAIEAGGTTYDLGSEELEVQKIEKEGYAVESSSGITVALLTEIDETLRNEGFAREMVNKIQNMRKSSGFEVTDRINIFLTTSDPLAGAVRQHSNFICDETLADKIELVNSLPEGSDGKNWNINGIKADIAVIRI